DIEIDLASDDAGAFDVQGVLSPRSIEFQRRGTQVRFPRIDGSIRFSDDAGSFTDLVARGVDWHLDLEGSWRRFGDSDLALDLRTSLEAPSLHEELRALLPIRLEVLRESIELAVDERLVVPDAVFQLRRTDGIWDVRSEGLVEFEGGHGLIGVQVTDAIGEASYQVESLGDDPPTYDIAVLGSSLRAASIALTDARIRLRSGLEERSLLVPLISADCHGGRLAGSARVMPRGIEADYQLDLRASGIEFAPVLSDFRADVVPVSDSRSRGVIDGEFSLSGTVLDPPSRRGRGTILVGGGAVVSMPLMLPLIQVSNMQVPGSSELDLATASFFVEGERVT
ncbi:MAG: hypothetical protein KDA28_11610, partial [Phycisphaerales bacterium]|nr:hypothetical protein [Phycisphaerales bacterium]